ncbi:MAG: c-type cytochrome [Oscillatoriales cyanobacterium SM2_2_1]|nr:c-type cytochrome [Oscillatoriales cyanobacterium SM2_2_1]
MWQLWFAPVAIAADLENGARLFGANCAACHAGGSNRVVAAKNLRKPALEQYGMYSLDAISYQVRNGKNAMPKFKKLSDDQIADVASYVLSQADSNWGKS